MKKIVAIVGSLRGESLNRQLAELAQKAVENRADMEILDYSGVPLFNEDIEFPTPHSVADIRQKIKSADGLWIFCPEYNHYFTGVLKNLLDWLSRPTGDGQVQLLVGRSVALSGITPGTSGTAIAQDHLVTLLSFLDMRIMNRPRLTVPSAYSQVENGRLKLSSSDKYLRAQADAFLAFIGA